MLRAGVRPSVSLSICPVGILTVTHQRAACDAASVHTTSVHTMTDILVVAEPVSIRATADAVPHSKFQMFVHSRPKCLRRSDRRNAPQCNPVHSVIGNTKRVSGPVIAGVICPHTLSSHGLVVVVIVDLT